MPQHLTPPLHTALREAVAGQFGQPLRYPSHCDALEAELQKEALASGGRISASTLRRFFGLVSKEGGYHLHTLDTLARYAGHADFAAFGRTLTAPAAGPAAPTDMVALLATESLSAAERLLVGYFVGRITRPATPQAPAAPLALRLAAHPAGQEFFVESFVDLAHLNGAYGEVLREYLRHKPTAEAQLFGYAALFLGEFLAADEPAWRARLRHLLALPVPADVHAFPHGRRAFAEIVAAWHDAPDGLVPPALLARLRHEAAAVPRAAAPVPNVPAFYNLFPAGYHFFVAEALFLTGQLPALREWLAFTQAAFPELATLEHNLYNTLLRAFGQVAAGTADAPSGGSGMSGLELETHTWLLDYYQVHLWLAELHLAVAAADVTAVAALQERIYEFAAARRMPFFQRVAARIAHPVLGGQRG